MNGPITTEEMANELNRLGADLSYNAGMLLASGILAFIQSRAAGVRGAGDAETIAAEMEAWADNQNWPRHQHDRVDIRNLAKRVRRLATPQPPNTIRVDVEQIGSCELDVRDGVAYMPDVTVQDIVSKSCLKPQPPKDADCPSNESPGDSLSLRGAAGRSVSRPHKDAGAVPLPELERFTHEIVPADKPYVHMAHDRSGNWCLYRDAIRYGNAREAAGRADAAPDPLDAAIAKGTKAWAGVPDSFVEDLRGEPAARAQVAGDGGLVDPLHLKKLYAVRRFVQSQMEIPKGVSLDSRRFLIQIIDADIEQIKAFSDTSPSPAHAGAGDADTKRLDALLSNSWDLRCFNIPTPGGDDADIGWRVIEHHLGEPRERVVGEIYKDDPRAAIDAARRLAGGDHA